MARIEVPMPQMGESIAEGTVSKWLKQVGDSVQRDEPILEISTDKVDAEIPSPSSGTLVEVAVEEGQTVEVGTIVAYIDTNGGGSTADPGAEDAAAEAGEEEVVEEQEAASPSAPATEAPVSKDGEVATAEERLRTRSTPVVRRMAEEHGLSLEDIEGTGHAGRVTKDDVLGFLEEGKRAPAKGDEEKPAAPGLAPAAQPALASAPSDLWSRFYGEVQHPEFSVGPNDRVEPMNKIRRLTAEHMVLAKRVAPHVHSFIEIDFSRIDRIRREHKKRWEEQGVRVSFTAFVAWACSRVLQEFPQVNGTVSGNNLLFRGDVNVGLAVDLDPGLIVPVIHQADHLGLVGIGKKLVDLAERARARKLSPGEIQGATFSITNPGVMGTLVGMPVIPKGTAAILGTGSIEKRPVVVEDPETGTDSIAIRKRCLFSLGYDHRIVDGADAARFLSRLKETLEDFPEDA